MKHLTSILTLINKHSDIEQLNWFTTQTNFVSSSFGIKKNSWRLRSLSLILVLPPAIRPFGFRQHPNFPQQLLEPVSPGHSVSALLLFPGFFPSLPYLPANIDVVTLALVILVFHSTDYVNSFNSNSRVCLHSADGIVVLSQIFKKTHLVVRQFLRIRYWRVVWRSTNRLYRVTGGITGNTKIMREKSIRSTKGILPEAPPPSIPIPRHCTWWLTPDRDYSLHDSISWI